MTTRSVGVFRGGRGFGTARRRQLVGGPPRIAYVLALTAAGVVSAASVVGVLPSLYALPVIGMLTAWGAGPGGEAEVSDLVAGPRNWILGSLVLAALGVVALQDLVQRFLIISFGTDLPSVVLTSVSVAALALPVAMIETTSQVVDPPVARMVANRRNLLLSVTAFATVATWHATVGLSFVILAALVIGLPAIIVASRFLQGRREVLELGFWRHPLSPGHGLYRFQLLNVVMFVVLMGWVVVAGTFDIARLYLPVGGYPLFQFAFAAGLVTLVAVALAPRTRVYWGTNLVLIAGSVFLGLQLISIHQPPSDPVMIVSPLAEEWYVSQGGRAELVNYHYVTSAQRHAIDLVQLVDGRTHTVGGSDLDDYYIFGAAVLAPSDGVVTSVVDGLADQPIGSEDHGHPAGNHIVIDVSGERYLLLAHLREGSVQVEVGDRVAAGQVIAQAGNSGSTTEPHVHMQAFNLPSFELASENMVELLRTVHTYPLVFRDVLLIRNRSVSEHEQADVRRGDSVRPFPRSP